MPLKHVDSSLRGQPPRSTEWEADVNGRLRGQQTFRDGRTPGHGILEQMWTGVVEGSLGGLSTWCLEGAVLPSLCHSPLSLIKRRNHLSVEDGEPQGKNDCSLSQRVP